MLIYECPECGAKRQITGEAEKRILAALDPKYPAQRHLIECPYGLGVVSIGAKCSI